MAPYALSGKLVAKPGQGAALAAALLSGAQADAMPGCQLYLVGTVASEPDAILVTEIWDDEASHKASLSIPAVREAVGKAMPLIERFEGEPMAILAGWPRG